jgi:hypothetical protein
MNHLWQIPQQHQDQLCAFPREHQATTTKFITNEINEF